MGVFLGRLFTVVAVIAGTAGCERRHPAVIGFAFGDPHPNVLDVVHAHFQGASPQRAGEAEPEIIDATGLRNEEGAPGAVTIAARFTKLPGIVGVVGHYDSRGTLSAAPVYDETHIPLLVPTATSRRLQTVSPWVFMMAPNDSLEAEFIAEFATRALRARNVTVFYDNDEYGIGLRDGLRGAFARHAVRQAADEPIAGPCGPANLADASIVRTTSGPRPDLVVIAGRTRDAACLSRRLLERAPRIRIIGTDAVEPDSNFFNRFDPSATTFFTVAFWHPAAGRTSQDFSRQFDSIVGMPPQPSQALAFDAVMLFARAAHEAGPRPDAVRRYLTELGHSLPEYAGVTGPISFGRSAHRPLYMLRFGARGSLPVVVQ